MQGLCTYPGIGQFVEASINLTHGISPSVARLTFVPQATAPADVGTLEFSFGGTAVSFPGCKVDHGTIERTAAGEIFQLSVLDRRWRWRFGQISGTYNVWRDNFSLRSGEAESIDTERTPQELATLCLEAMGETGFDVSDMPNDARPSVEWDFALPAAALAALCDELGCRVVLQLDNTVAIRRVGVGTLLFQSSALAFSATLNLPERPDALVVVGGPNRYQVDFQLEAVGLSTDEEEGAEALVPIDELDYCPAGGWSTVDLPYFHQVDVASRSMALKSVFRYYRIKSPIEVPGYAGPGGNQVSLEQILPIEDEQVAVGVENGQLANRPATVFGVWFPDTGDVVNSAESLVPLEHAAPSSGSPSLGMEYRGPFTIDAARGLVIFEEPVYRNAHDSGSGGSGFELTVAPAQLVLRAACSVRDAETLALERYGRYRATGAELGTPPRYLAHDEIVLAHRPSYSESYELVDVETNAADVDAMADYYLDAVEQEYAIEFSQFARYPGLVLVELDGAIQHVGFHVDTRGTTTTVSRNSDAPRFGRPHWHMRRIERQRAAERMAARLTPHNQARALKTNLYTKSRPKS